jgi:hypothetical protein
MLRQAIAIGCRVSGGDQHLGSGFAVALRDVGGRVRAAKPRYGSVVGVRQRNAETSGGREVMIAVSEAAAQDSGQTVDVAAAWRCPRSAVQGTRD